MKHIKRILIILLCIMSVSVMPATNNVLPITANAATSVKLNESAVYLIKGNTYQLKLVGSKKKVKWSSSKKSVATVTSKGKVTAKGKGSAVITAKAGSKKYKCKITVSVATYSNRMDLPLDQVNKAWHYHFSIYNTTSEIITLTGISIVNIKNGKVVDRIPLSLKNEGLVNLKIKPEEEFQWHDNHPYTKEFNSREYLFTFQTESGKKITHSYIFDMKKSATVDGKVYKYTETLEIDSKNDSWHYFMNIENPLSQDITFKSVSIVDLKNDKVLNTIGLNLAQWGFENKVLGPNEFYTWQDNHPYTKEFDGREYQFGFEAADGTKLTICFVYKMTAETRGKTGDETKDYSKDTGYDLKTLRINANFKVKVGNGVYWVPASTLGKSSYTNEEISKLVNSTPEEKQAKIDTLYEAIQLYQIGNFAGGNDNVRIMENGINWEHHKPGYYSVLSNGGCCASDSSWLSYILRGDYEDIGYLQISQRDGSGHVINYIKYNGWYYILDLTHHRNDFLNSAVETGLNSDYYSVDFILGNIHAVQRLEDYANYFVSKVSDPPGLFVQEKMDEVPAIEGVWSGSTVTLTYGEDKRDQLTVLYDDKTDNLEIGFAKAPKRLPDWASICRR